MPQPARGIGRALRHRNYRLFFSGQLVSLIGTWMQSTAQAWLIYRLTGSSVLLGLVGFSSQIPVFLVAPFGGTLADRARRHRVLLSTQSMSMVLALILAALTLSGVVEVWHVFVLAPLFGLVNAFDIPARQSFITEIVQREDLLNAVALNSSMVNGARIVGPALAGIIIAAVGEGWCFLANGVSYIAVLTGLLCMRNLPARRAKPSASPLEQVLEGFRFVHRTRPIRQLLLLLGFVSLMGMSYTVLMPIFADRIIAGGPRALGLLMGASGAGALTGALLLAARTSMRGLGRWIALACALFGVSLVAFSFSRNLLLSMALLYPAGLGMMIQMSASNTLVQTMSPDSMRGRVMALYSMMFMGMAPFGALLAGSLAEHIGATWTVMLGGTCCALAALVFGLRLAEFREEAHRIIVAMPAMGGDPPEQTTGARPAA
ncbi:MAG TPA: MFS transporter [Polyangiaceae bacterium]|nr:MFS transporter [Polyangiaceae bacterium]